MTSPRAPSRLALYADPSPTSAPPDEALPLPTPSRRDLRLHHGQLWLDRHAAAWPPAGHTVQALLEAARPTVLDRLPATPRRELLERALTWLSTPTHAPDPIARLQLDAALGACALITTLCAPQLTNDDPRPTQPELPGADALLRHARHQAGLGPAAPEAAIYLELADWLLGPRPVWGYREHRYDFSWEDVGLYWVGLLRSVDLAAFDLFRSGHVMLHLFSPAGTQIAPDARLALEAELANRPGPQRWTGWHDVLLPWRERLGPEAPPSAATTVPQDAPALTPSSEQREALAPFADDPDLPELLQRVAAWFPEAAAAGAIAPTALRAALRALRSPLPTLAALDLEQPLAAWLRNAREELTERRFGGLSLPDEAVAPLSELVRHRLDHPDDAEALLRWLRRQARGGALSPEAWHQAEPTLTAFLHGTPAGEAAPWLCWPAFTHAARLGQPWATLGHDPVHPCEARERLTAPLWPGPAAAHHLNRRLLDLFDRLCLLHSLAADEVGPVPALTPPVHAELGDATHATAALVLRDGHGGRWVIDSQGRLQPATAPLTPWFTAELGPTLRLHPRPIALPDHPVHPVVRETGDLVPLEGRLWVLSALHNDGTATATEPTRQRTRALDLHDLRAPGGPLPSAPAALPPTPDPAAAAHLQRQLLHALLTGPDARAPVDLTAAAHTIGATPERGPGLLWLCLADGAYVELDPTTATITRSTSPPPASSRLRKLRDRCERPMQPPAPR